MNEKGPGGADRLGQGQTKAGGPRPLAAQTCAYLFLQWSLKKNNCKHLEIRDSLSFFCLSVSLPTPNNTTQSLGIGLLKAQKIGQYWGATSWG